METSGFKPAAPEPSEQPGGFTPAPAPTAPAEGGSGGWTYSFVAETGETPTASAGPAVPTVALEPLTAPFPPPAAAPVYDFGLEPAAPPGTETVPAYPQEATATYGAGPTRVPDEVAPARRGWQADVVSLLPAETGHLAVVESEASEDAYRRGSTEDHPDEEGVDLNGLLLTVLERGASDLHLTSGARPAIRLNGALRQLEDQPMLTPPVIQRVLYAAMTQKQREKFEENLELDFSYSVPGRARFRVNVYRQRDALGAAFRIIPFEIKKLEALGVPPAVANFAQLPRGFVLVTGPTGSGKSTTLASLVDLANRTRDEHIMTVEDPIEFLHRHQRCIVNQREVGEDTWSFSSALKHVLRQDPDIILVGEMRDLETISVALTAAETGHLVFATLHTSDAAQTIDRIIDVFPPHQQQQVRVQLAGSLQGVVCQTLAKTADGKGRAVATEVLVATPAVRNLIREGKTHQIYSAMQAGAKHGMHTMDQHLADLVVTGRITYETGLEKCHHLEDFNRLAGRA
ncbi:MAG: twitching motility protein PilT [Actinomycetota bacterium]|nr:twitching motility protein PilT [Actinomycetota bacterium]